MVTCPRCGASIEPMAPACPYCQMQTQYGREQAERHAAHQYHSAQAVEAQRASERQTRQQALTKKATHALLCSLAGAVTCCFPFAIVGLVMGLNVKSAAKREGMVAPGTSTVAVVFGGCAIALSLAVIALYINDSREVDARVAALKTEVDAARARESLDQRLACGLVELELLQEGYAGKGGISIGGFQCDGKVEQSGERAALYDVRFRTGSDERHVVTACLVRGSRWSIKELRKDSSCDARPASAPSASPSAR